MHGMRVPTHAISHETTKSLVTETATTRFFFGKPPCVSRRAHSVLPCAPQSVTLNTKTTRSSCAPAVSCAPLPNALARPLPAQAQSKHLSLGVVTDEMGGTEQFPDRWMAKIGDDCGQLEGGMLAGGVAVLPVTRACFKNRFGLKSGTYV